MNSPYQSPKKDSQVLGPVRPGPTVFSVLAAMATLFVFGCLSLGFIVFGAGMIIVAVAGPPGVEQLLGALLVLFGLGAAYSGWMTAVNVYHWGNE